MAEPHAETVLDRVRRALGRTVTPASIPPPPPIPDLITRLVPTDLGLPELFTKRAEENKIHVDRVYVDELPARLVEFLRSQNCTNLILPDSPFLEQLGIYNALDKAGLNARRWSQATLDETYDMHAAVTDVYCAVAETGSLVIRASEAHGRSISLVPDIHIAIVQPKDMVADLVDFFDKMKREGQASSTIIITGPSKTADIEMALVIGVHGPRLVQVFLLQ